MTDCPLVTILLCTHAGEATVAAALESALAQRTDVPYEVVVEIDGVVDDTHAIVRKYSYDEPRIRTSVLGKHQGLVHACNHGLKMACGQFVTRLDDDDLLHPDAVERLSRHLREGRADWACCDRSVVDVKTGGMRRAHVGPISGQDGIARLAACGVMYWRNLVLDLGGYRDLFWAEHDLNMRYAALSRKPLHHVAAPLYLHAARPEGENEAMRRGWAELAGLWGGDALLAHGFTRHMEDGPCVSC